MENNKINWEKCKTAALLFAVSFSAGFTASYLTTTLLLWLAARVH